MKRIALCLLSVLAFATAADARWGFDSKSSAFDDSKIAVAFTADDAGYAFIVRCLPSSGLGVRFITPETVSGEAERKQLATVPFKMLLRVDDSPVQTFDVEVNFVEDAFAIDAEIDASDAEGIRAAHRRIAVAADLFGERPHEAEFDAVGAFIPIGKVITACKK